MVVGTPRNTRQEVLLVAADLFRRQGYGATSVGQVAEAAGISKGNLTYHFPNKMELFREVVSEVAAYVRDRILADSFSAAPDMIAGFEEFARRLRRRFVDSEGRFVGCLFTNIAVETRHSDPEVAGLASASLYTLREAVAARIAEGQARGDIRRDQEAGRLTHAFFWMYEGALILSRAQGDAAEYDAFCSYLREFLSPPPSSQKGESNGTHDHSLSG